MKLTAAVVSATKQTTESTNIVHDNVQTRVLRPADFPTSVHIPTDKLQVYNQSHRTGSLGTCDNYRV